MLLKSLAERPRECPRKNVCVTHSSSYAGFTIIEFSLATAFISLLLIAIIVIAGQISTIYQKGLSVKAVNSVGRGLIDELNSSINSAPSVDTTNLCTNHIESTDATNIAKCKQDSASKYIFQHKTATRSAPGGETTADNTVQLGGVFCTGNYSYIWNTYYGREAGRTQLSLKYTYLDNTGSHTATLSGFRLAKVKDPTYRVCSTLVSKNYQSLLTESTNVIDITKLSNGRDNITEMAEANFLRNFDLELSLYEFTIFPISQDAVTLRTFMSGTFILATDRGNVNIERTGDFCDTQGFSDDPTTTALLDLGSEFTYCGINRFNFAARTAGM